MSRWGTQGRRTKRQRREEQGPISVALRTMVRKMVAGATAASGLWQLLGFKYRDPDTGKDMQETDDGVDLFPGIGFHARPPAGSQPEVIVARVGADGHSVIIATRDRSTQIATLEDDETAVFNSKAVLIFKKNGEVWITDRAGGTAKRLATDDHTHVLPPLTSPSGAVTEVAGVGTISTGSPNAAGVTTWFKAQ